jgi:hypothetical protein
MFLRNALRMMSVVALAAGCGSSSSGGTHDAKQADAPLYDFGCGGNTACPTTQVCCTKPGNPTTFSCVDPGSCSSANKITCDGPDECGGGTPVCCGADMGDGTGTYPQCGIGALGTTCTSATACPTHFATTCTDTTKVQICHVSSECTDATNNKCCTFMSGGATLTFCIDQGTANLAHAVCH